MTDIIDRATDAQQKQLDQAISAAKITQSRLPKGRCNYCGEAVNDTFCDIDCRNDYEREQRIMQQNGRK